MEWITIKRPFAALRRWMRYRNNIRALSQLDNRLLSDIGLTRAGIKQAAKEASR